MNKSTIIKVLNRDNGAVTYFIPEMNGLKRVFQAGETKQVTFEELEKLSYIPGGMELLKDSLIILNNPAAASELLGHIEPEYFYTKEDIIKLMTTGTLDEFLDCLDFAPEGVKDLIKTLSVELPLNDVSKREAVLNKLGFNVDNAIRIKREIESNDTADNSEEVTQRRVQKPELKTTTTINRRVVTSKN